ncbi:hypothetical protein BH11PLA2_BH11PLA2_42890 [soil metagenome]
MLDHLLLLALIAGVDPVPAMKEPTYTIETKGPDTIVAETEQERTLFVVTSERGIGRAVLTAAKNEWPANVTLRFRHAEGKAFTALEGITVTTDRIVMTGAVKVTDLKKDDVTLRMGFAFLDADGKPFASQLDGKNGAGTLDIRAKRHDGGLELTLPARMLRGSSKLSLGWTDWYR